MKIHSVLLLLSHVGRHTNMVQLTDVRMQPFNSNMP
jgi:hypothetical protein